MARRSPRAIGTAAETAVVRYLREHGFPGADRQPLRGILDTGDIDVTAGIIAEVKAGAMAATASVRLIRQWQAHHERKRRDSGADIGILVVRQRQRPPAQWHVWTTAHQLDILRGGHSCPDDLDGSVPVMLLLGDWADEARRLWGDAS